MKKKVTEECYGMFKVKRQVTDVDKELKKVLKKKAKKCRVGQHHISPDSATGPIKQKC